MAKCGAVRNASRPIERCHEMSHCAPIIADVTASTDPATGQGIAVRSLASSRGVAAALMLIDASLPGAGAIDPLALRRPPSFEPPLPGRSLPHPRWKPNRHVRRADGSKLADGLS
jgi:hypothetical protein